MKKTPVFLLAAPPLAALLLLLTGSLFPLRLDCRTLQHLTKFEGLENRIKGARQIIYLSRDNGVASGQMAAFTLRHLAFPDTARTWLILAENRAGEWWGEWLAVDEKGGFFAPGRPPPALVPAPAPPGLDLAESRIVCDSRDVFQQFQRRIPALAGARDVVFLDDFPGRGGFVFSKPRSEFSAARFLRLSLLIGALLATAMLVGHWAGDCRIGLPAGLVGGIAAQIWLASISWQAWPILLAAQWAAGIFLLRNTPPLPPPRLTGATFCTAAVLAITLVVYLVRLDFDGDVITHWLPMARSFYHLGHHDPATLLAQGSMHAATYPPGYGIFIAMTMWAADMDPIRSFLPGPASSLAILFYRLAIWLLNMSFLGLLAACMIRRTPRGSWLWLAGISLVVGILPTVRGTHVAAETLLFPVLGSALVLLVAAPGRLPLVGIALAGISTLIKWEAALLVGAIFIPWFLTRMILNPSMRTPRFLVLAAAVGAAAIVPALVWKAGLHIDNGFFNPPSLGAVWTGRSEWASLLLAAVIFLLKSPLWIPLFLLLPAGWILGLRRGFRWADALVPTATALLFFAFVSMYLFSNWTSKTLHIEQSLDRLLYLPALSCILYFLGSLDDRDEPDGPPA